MVSARVVALAVVPRQSFPLVMGNVSLSVYLSENKMQPCQHGLSHSGSTEKLKPLISLALGFLCPGPTLP